MEDLIAMRNSLVVIALSSLLVLSLPAAAALAQDNPQSEGGRRHGGQGRMNPDRQLERLTQELGLSSDQQAQIRPLLVDRQQKMAALFQDQSLSQDERRQQMRSIAEMTHNGIKGFLNPEQKQKFEQMHHRGGHGGSGEDQPQPQQ
jgi:periplasmic protein CpxP/Spy